MTAAGDATSNWTSSLLDIQVGKTSVATSRTSQGNVSTFALHDQASNLKHAINATLTSKVFNQIIDQLSTTKGKEEFDIEIRYIGDEVKFYLVDNPGAAETVTQVGTDIDFETTGEKATLIQAAKAVNDYAFKFIQATAPKQNTRQDSALAQRVQSFTSEGDQMIKECTHAGIRGEGMSPKRKQDGKILQGIANGVNGCYASSATELLRHIPSLRTEVTEKQQSDQRRALVKGTSASQILTETRKLFSDPKSELKPNFGYDAGDFYSVFIGRLKEAGSTMPVDHDKPASQMLTPIETTRKYKSKTSSEIKDRVETAPGYSLQLPLSRATGKYISFEHGLNSALNETTMKTGETLTDGLRGFDQVQETHRFAKAPHQLFIKPKRFGRESQKDPRAMIDVPFILDLNKAGAMKDGVLANPLELKGFIVHGGRGTGLVGGHYVSYFQKDDKWYHANDTEVFEVDLEEVQYAVMFASDLYYDDALTEAGKEELEAMTLYEQQSEERISAPQTELPPSSVAVSQSSRVRDLEDQIGQVDAYTKAFEEFLDAYNEIPDFKDEIASLKGKDLSSMNKDEYVLYNELRLILNSSGNLPKAIQDDFYLRLGKTLCAKYSLTASDEQCQEIAKASLVDPHSIDLPEILQGLINAYGGMKAVLLSERAKLVK